ncbi:efflux RND transporter periplasmic adaptor subunit [Roseateles puraquae]|uniref:efflux RND transporter periplasmic adaptor subunit n=1 Tax=Roseateles puraquae TaxID=431059 RepID=UPI0031DEC9D7
MPASAFVNPSPWCRRLALVAVLASLGLSSGCTDSASQPLTRATTADGPAADEIRFAEGSPQLTMVRSAPAEAFPMPIAQPLEARLVYDEDATSRLSVPVSGRVTALLARPGDTVRRGQPLLALDSPDLGTALADLERADADLALKQKTVARLQDLSTGEAIARRDLEQALADLAQARAERGRAERRLHNLNPGGLPMQGQRLTLGSPLDGVVVERNANLAMEVSPAAASPLFVVSSLRQLWVLADLPERLAGQVRPGDKLVVEPDALPQARREARVLQVGPGVDPATRRVVLKAAVDNRDGRLLPEMFVRAWLQAGPGAAAVRLPNTAVVVRGVQSFVFVETAPGRFKRRRVELAARGGDDSFVREGVAAGDRVVTQGALLLDAELSAPADGSP